MFPDLTNATVAGKPALDLITEDWYENELIPTVAKRGSAIIQARGHSSAASAANAAIDHIHDWVLGSNGEWATMAVPPMVLTVFLKASPSACPLSAKTAITKSLRALN